MIQSVTFLQKIAIARYLMALFPNLQSLSKRTDKPRSGRGPEDYRVDMSQYSLWEAMDWPAKKHTYEPREVEFWEEVENLVQSYQETRRQAFAEASRVLPYHDA